MKSPDYAALAQKIVQAEALVITAGAGMGVDSGLPDFRGDQGFWQAYPMYQHLGLSFVDAANPVHFGADPAFGWGFYGHRTNLYRQTVPHQGFTLLRQWGQAYGQETFVVTSNVDGQFQKAGFSDQQILEVHGSIHHLQCTTPCTHDIWPNDEHLDIDLATMRSKQIPRCPACKAAARPNILMFGDYSWLHQRTGRQESTFHSYLSRNQTKKMVVIEIGAGSAIPTIRHLSENLGRRQQCTVIRINPREAEIIGPHHSCQGGALKTLEAIDKALKSA